MKTMMKYATAAALAGALAAAAVTPGEARDGRNAAAAIGFGAGALVGAAAASSAYNNGYYGYADPGYAYAPGYAYESAPIYDDSYAYEPSPRYRYYDRWSTQHNTNNFSIDSQR